eukprot:TRINITY_DN93692_c0_g1_i1.p1 TRINITY_DN93692_c0_g1~~TRINITY_DN93692_c0_g1_i1.p1  ORF type:complete len:653 (-),score=106.51 TRINITY_DN93692_c0_g1_i1:110-1852(-)
MCGVLLAGVASKMHQRARKRSTRIRTIAQSGADSEARGGKQTSTAWTQREQFKLAMEYVTIAYGLFLGVGAVGVLGRPLLSSTEKVFTLLFVIEATLRIAAERGQYFRDRQSLVDLGLTIIMVNELLLPRDSILFTGFPVLMRLARSAFRLARSVGALQKAPPHVLRLAGVAVFVALNAELKAFGLQSVVGMLGVFGLMVAVRQYAGAEKAGKLYTLLEPGKAFLVKWGTLFFVPALIKLPLAESLPRAVLSKLAVCLFVGSVGTFACAGYTAQLFPQSKAAEKAESVAEEAERTAQAKTGNVNQKPYPRRLVVAYTALMSGAFLTSRLLPGRQGIAEDIFMFSATLLGFILGMKSPASFKKMVHPLLTCLLVTWTSGWLYSSLPGARVGFMQILTRYAAWPHPGALLSDMLGPAVIALGLLLFERRRLLWNDLFPILGTSVTTAFATLFGTALLARGLGLPGELARSSLLRSISSPFAMELTTLLRASGTYAIAMVVLTGFLGVAIGPSLLRLLRIKSPRARGLATGAAAHGLGTVALAESDEAAFPYSAVGYVIMGTATSALLQMPFVRGALLRIVAL